MNRVFYHNAPAKPSGEDTGARHKSSSPESHGSAGVLAGRVKNKRAPLARFKCSGAIYYAPFYLLHARGDARAHVS